jgi:hypothetical protein
MYCPNCGQQQVSDEMRFCSRCGLALGGVSEWLARGGVPATAEDKAGVAADSPRRKNMRRAAKLMFFSAALFPIFLLISIAEDTGEPIIVPVVFFLVSLAWMLYARLFSDKHSPVTNHAAQTSALGSTVTREALPPAATMPMPDIRRQQVKTNELAQPPSVTENTTRLLDNE